MTLDSRSAKKDVMTQPTLIQQPAPDLKTVPLAEIRPPHSFGAHSDAARAMAVQGQNGTVLLRPLHNDRDGFLYEVIDGARRILAAFERGDDSVMAIIRTVDNYGAALGTLSMNLTGGDNPVAQAVALRKAMLNGQTLEKIGYDSGIRLGTLKRVKRLAELPEDVLMMADTERVSPGTLEKVAALPAFQQKRAVDRLRAMKGNERFTANDLAAVKQVQSLDTAVTLEFMLSSQPAPIFDPLDTAAAQVRSMAKSQGVSVTELAQRLLANPAGS